MAIYEVQIRAVSAAFTTAYVEANSQVEAEEFACEHGDDLDFGCFQSYYQIDAIEKTSDGSGPVAAPSFYDEDESDEDEGCE